MTTTRDADRILRAWLDLMPDEAPDRTVAAVLQAVETTPQTRRPVLRGPRRSASMNRFSLIAAAAVLGAAVVGVALFAGGAPNNQPAPTPAALAATPAPSASTSPSASADAKAPSSLVGTWFGPGRDVPGIVGGSGSRLLITDTGVAFGTPNDQGRPLLSAELVGSDRRHAQRDVGSRLLCSDRHRRVQWSLSARGTVLAVTAPATRAPSAPQRSRAPGGRPGARSGRRASATSRPDVPRSSSVPDHNQASEWGPLFGGIGYTVPEGWANSADWPSRFMLTPSTSYADEGFVRWRSVRRRPRGRRIRPARRSPPGRVVWHEGRRGGQADRRRPGAVDRHGEWTRHHRGGADHHRWAPGQTLDLCARPGLDVPRREAIGRFLAGTGSPGSGLV